MRKQQGFTLIELVVVIIILGILAVVAAPKFINLQSDARVSALQGLKGAIQGANSLVYSKAALAGKENEPSTTLDIAGTTDTKDDVSIVYGYMAATSNALTAGANISTNDWKIEAPASGVSSATLILYPANATTPTATSKCFVEYSASSGKGNVPEPKVVSTNC
jgi:MSHA pilin protein MshA